MQVHIKRLDNDLPLPEYKTSGAVGFDILCRVDTVIEPHKVGLIPGNIIVKTPPGYMLLLALRSSTPKKKGLIKPHGIGVIDQDYCGEEDEVKIQVYNITEARVTVERGERIAQGIFVKIEKCDWDEQQTMGGSRGGFGSTG